jgi:hypothetical protein
MESPHGWFFGQEHRTRRTRNKEIECSDKRMTAVLVLRDRLCREEVQMEGLVAEKLGRCASWAWW